MRTKDFCEKADNTSKYFWDVRASFLPVIFKHNKNSFENRMCTGS